MRKFNAARFIAIVLVLVGLGLIGYDLISCHREKKVLELGPVTATVQTEPDCSRKILILGLVVAAVGGTLLAYQRKNR